MQFRAVKSGRTYSVESTVEGSWGEVLVGLSKDDVDSQFKRLERSGRCTLVSTKDYKVKGRK